MEDIKAINIRIPGALHTKLQLSAVQNDETMQSIVQRGVERELYPPENNGVKQFCGIALAMAKGNTHREVADFVRDARLGSRAVQVTKDSSIGSQGWAGAWADGSGRSLVNDFLTSLVPAS